MDALALLALQIDWGADEALLEAPVDRLAARPAPSPRMLPETTARVPHALAQPSQPRAAPEIATPEIATPAITAGTLEEWRAAVRGFTGCALRETATNPVLAAGHPASGLMVIGDPPGAEDDRSGLPFQGPAGAVLDRILHALGIQRDQLVLAPLIPWRPPGNRPPTDTELAQCLPLLHRLIALCAPRWIVLNGILPVRALLGQGSSLARLRGRWTDLHVSGLETPVPALPMPGLANLKTAADRRDVWAYWRMLQHTMRVK